LCRWIKIIIIVVVIVVVVVKNKADYEGVR